MTVMRLFLCAVCVLGWAGALAADAGAESNVATQAEPGALTVTGIAPRTNDDDPRVLYIMPWQPPSLPRRPRTPLNDRAPKLKQAVDPLTLERHRYFRKTLDPDINAAVPRQ